MCCRCPPVTFQSRKEAWFAGKTCKKDFECISGSTQASNKRINFIIRMIFLEMLTAQRTLRERKE